MKKIMVLSIMLCLGLSLGIIGCGQKEDAAPVIKDTKKTNIGEIIGEKKDSSLLAVREIKEKTLDVVDTTVKNIDSTLVNINEIKDKTLDVAGTTVQKVDSISEQVKTVEEAVKISGLLKTAEEKVNYLLGQATSFYDLKKFQSAADVTQYILTNVDSNSLGAKNLLEKAKQALIEKAKEAVGAATENLTNKIESFGK